MIDSDAAQVPEGVLRADRRREERCAHDLQIVRRRVVLCRAEYRQEAVRAVLHVRVRGHATRRLREARRQDVVVIPERKGLDGLHEHLSRLGLEWHLRGCAELLGRCFRHARRDAMEWNAVACEDERRHAKPFAFESVDLEMRLIGRPLRRALRASATS